MKINKLKINSYGKLKEKEENLKNKLNIIYGQNEAGKSTLINFIINSFYGISKNKKGKEISDYEKYKPWTGEDFSGKVEYELDDGKKFETLCSQHRAFCDSMVYTVEKLFLQKTFYVCKRQG